MQRQSSSSAFWYARRGLAEHVSESLRVITNGHPEFGNCSRDAHYRCAFASGQLKSTDRAGRAGRDHWSVHYNIARDGKLFAGDGGGPGSVANQTPLPGAKRLDSPGNGQWIYLFTPTDALKESIKVGDEAVKVGKLAVEKLVDLSKHDYRLEPNVTITPDNKWVVFRSNMHGATHVYAVEVAKSK